jgi:hypothetical protein
MNAELKGPLALRMTESSFRLFQSCPQASARTLLGHTPEPRIRGKLAPMIQFDQFLIAMVVCFVAAHLLIAT